MKNKKMTSLASLTALLISVGFQMLAEATDKASESLVGTWRLITYTDTPEGKPPVQAFGEHPIGYFIFTADGHASVSLMRNPPDIKAPTSDPDPDACIPGWYCAYFGTYTVDSKNNVFSVHVVGSNVPSFMGTDQTRHYRLQGNKLIIAETYLDGATRIHAYRELVREILTK